MFNIKQIFHAIYMLETSGFTELYRWKKQLVCMGIELAKLLEIAIFFIGILTLGSNQSLFSTILSA